MSDEIEITPSRNFVKPYADNNNAAMIPFRDVAGEMIRLPTNGETDANALIGIGATSEKSTPNERAIATVKKLLAFCGVATGITIFSMFLTDSSAIIAIVEIVGILIACVITIWLDRDDSPLATERSKAKDYRAIRLGEISSQERMFNRRMDTLERITKGFFNADYRKDK